MNFIKVIASIFVLITLVSCSKDNSEGLMYDSQYGFAAVSIFNAVSNSDGLVVSVGHNNKEVRNMLAASDHLKFGEYFGYRNWFPGDWELFIQNRSADRVESSRDKLYLQNGNSYSLFVFRKNSIKHVLKQDNIISPKDGKVKIRIANFLDGLDDANVFLPHTKQVLFKDLYFASVTDFIEVDIMSANSFIVKSGDGQIELVYSDDRQLTNKGVYTILLKGSLLNSEGKENQDFIKIIKQY